MTGLFARAFAFSLTLSFVATAQERSSSGAAGGGSWATSSARELVARAERLARANRIAEALTKCNEAIRMDPSHGGAYLTLGRLRERMRDAREAELAYTKAVKLPDSSADALAHRAALRQRTGRAGDAFRDLEESVRLDATKPERLETLATWYSERRAWPAALALWRRIATLDGASEAKRARAQTRVAALAALSAATDPVTSIEPREPSWVRRALASMATRAR